MTYTTGRTRTLTVAYSASLNGAYMGLSGSSISKIFMGGQCAGWLGTASIGYAGEVLPGPGGYIRWQLLGGVTLRNPLTPPEDTMRGGALIAEETTNTDIFDISGSFEVEFSISIDLEECCTVSYTGSSDVDALESSCKFFERPRIGGYVSGIAEWSGGSLSFTEEIEPSSVPLLSNDGVFTYPQGFSAGAWCNSLESLTSGKTITCSFSWVPFSASVEFPGLSGELNVPGQGDFASFDASSAGALNFTVTDNIGTSDSGVGVAIHYAWPARYTYRDPSFESMGAHYGNSDGLLLNVIGNPNSSPLEPIPASSSFSISQGGAYAQVVASAFGSVDVEKIWISGEPFVGEKISPVSATLVPESLKQAGDDPTDNRLQFRGVLWDALKLSHDAALLIDACSSTANWTAGPNVTLLAPVSHLEISSTANEGYATLAVGSDVQVWEAYRYLRITAKAALPVTVGVLIAGRIWELPLTTSSQPILLDLCCASDETSSVGDVQSRYPSVSFDPSRSQTAYAFGWGVNFCDQLRIVGIPAGQMITLTDISLVVAGDSSVSLMAPFGTVVSGRKQFAFLQADDRVSDWPLSNSSGLRTIQELANYLEWVPGISANALPPLPDTFHSSARYAFLLGGGGMSFDWNTNTWTRWLDRSTSSELTIPAQDLYDKVQGYPGIGNPWDGSEYPDPSEDEGIPLVVGKVLRGQGTGLVFLVDNQPYPDLSVTAFSDEGAFVGAGVTSTNGAYRTGSPFGFGNTISLTGIVGPDFEFQEDGLWQNRQRYRVAIRTLPVPCAGADPRNPWSCGSGTLNVAIGSNCAVAAGCDCEQPESSALPMPGPQ